MINILVVEDHLLIRSAIVKLLADIPEIRVIAEAEDGENAIRITQDKSPHVVLMDFKMPGMGGLEATRKILQHNADIKIIILTAYSSDPLASQLFQAGARGYLTKGASLEEMVNAIQTVYSGKYYISPCVAQKLAFGSLEGSHTSPLAKLSDREQQVMRMLTNGKSIQKISEELSINPKTINTYRYRLYEKLNVQTDVELTLFAMRHGILEDQ